MQPSFFILFKGHREGYGKLNFGTANRRKLELEYIEGIYKNDILEGPGKIVYDSGEKLICEFVNGAPNGPGKLFDKKGQLKQVKQLFYRGKQDFLKTKVSKFTRSTI